jgi:hypothetical protein
MKVPVDFIPLSRSSSSLISISPHCPIFDSPPVTIAAKYFGLVSLYVEGTPGNWWIGYFSMTSITSGLAERTLSISADETVIVGICSAGGCGSGEIIPCSGVVALTEIAWVEILSKRVGQQKNGVSSEGVEDDVGCEAISDFVHSDAVVFLDLTWGVVWGEADVVGLVWVDREFILYI